MEEGYDGGFGFRVLHDTRRAAVGTTSGPTNTMEKGATAVLHMPIHGFISNQVVVIFPQPHAPIASQVLELLELSCKVFF